jgi:DNA-binding transcriptional LysR family regulator
MLAEPFIRAIQGLREKIRLRFIDMSPQEVQRAAMTGAIDIAIHFEKFDWTSSWTSAESAELRWSLFARKLHPLSDTAQLSDVLKFPFVVPGHWAGDKLITGEDGFPIPWRNRVKGHEVQTAANALRIVRSTNQLVFLPTVLAREFLNDEEVKTIGVCDLAVVKKAVYVSAQTERVTQKQFRLLVNAVKDLVKSEALDTTFKKFGAGIAPEVSI